MKDKNLMGRKVAADEAEKGGGGRRRLSSTFKGMSDVDDVECIRIQMCSWKGILNEGWANGPSWSTKLKEPGFFSAVMSN
jgi:hypothetical protein